jgi:hypothetical protein
MFGASRFAPMPPMLPMVYIVAGPFEGVSRLPPSPNCLLAGQQETSNAGSGQLLNARSEILATALLGISQCLHCKIELVNGNRLIAMLLPPESEKIAEFLATSVPSLCLSHPLNRATVPGFRWL